MSTLKRDKIIITGATGFAGSHILQSFLNIKNVVASCKNIENLPSSYKGDTLEGNLKDNQYIERLTTKAHTICHAASWAELNGTFQNSKYEFLDPTINLIDKAVQNGVKRFVFLSAITSKPIEELHLHSSLALENIWAHYASIMKIEAYLKEASKGNVEIVILRVGYFIGENYALGLLPILLPRLKTHLVPYIQKGETSLPLIDGADIGLAFKLAAIKPLKNNLTILDIVGKETPTVKEVFQYLHDKYHYPLPHFSVSFNIAYLFARFMRGLDKFLPFEALIVPSIVLLLEETHANNKNAEQLLNYFPQVDWKKSIDVQIEQMNKKQIKAMRMNKK